MRRIWIGCALGIALVSCGQQTPSSELPASTSALQGTVAQQLAQLAQRPELQDADSQEILRQHPNDVLLLQGLKEAYGLPNEGLEAAALATQVGAAGLSAQASGKAGYAQSVAWGSVSNYNAERRSPNYSGLDWNYDGCSAPKGLGLGYSSFFKASCNVHDFGYRNLPDLTSIPTWPYSKGRTDVAFLNNMRVQCGAKGAWERPGCYAAATAYYTVVDEFGWAKWHR